MVQVSKWTRRRASGFYYLLVFTPCVQLCSDGAIIIIAIPHHLNLLYKRQVLETLLENYVRSRCSALGAEKCESAVTLCT